MDYKAFLASKHRLAENHGIQVDAADLNPRLFPWQRKVVQWALRKGRCALFEDCGLGKTIQELAFADALYRLRGVHTLLLCPVAVAQQTAREAAKFGIETPVHVVADQAEVRPGICVTNYEKLHRFDLSYWTCVILGESSILKNYTGATKRVLCESFAGYPYRLCETATPAPNDHMELGNHSEFLGIMPSNEMLARWFINDTMKAGGYRVAKHAKRDFWRWVASWAVCLKRPSDIGYSDEGYELPPLHIHEHVIEPANAPAGCLFDVGSAVTATTVHAEKRRTLTEKAELVASLVNDSPEPWAVWCDTDYEADALQKAIPEAIEVRGSHSERSKEERLTAFSEGRARVIITKPEIGGFGLNWQHCCNTTCFAGFSFERWYQLIRRFYRFAQLRPVNAHIISSINETGVLTVLKRKHADYEEMIEEMVAAMRDGMADELNGAIPLAKYSPSMPMDLPAWIHTHSEEAA